MKRFLVTLVLGGIALAGFLYVQPRLTMRVLAQSLQTSDLGAVRERMDAERVRQSLRAGYLARLGGTPTDADREGAVVASLALFSRGLEMVMATVGNGEDQRAGLSDWTFETSSRVRTTLRQDDEPPYTLVLERQRTSWQLVAMEPSASAWNELTRGGAAPLRPK